MTRALALLGTFLVLVGCGESMAVATENLEAAEETGELTGELASSVAVGTQVRTTANLNLRTGPGTGYRVLLVIPRGAAVTTVERSTPSSGFYKLKYNGTVGWAYGSYLSASSGGDNQWTRPIANYRRTQLFTGHSAHNGIDLAKAYGSTVYAAHAGRVTQIIRGFCRRGYNCKGKGTGWGFDGQYSMSGDKVVVTHSDGKKTIYDHMGSAGLSYVGMPVVRDTPIGRINATGNRTGPHLHFSVWNGKMAVNPLIYVKL